MNSGQSTSKWSVVIGVIILCIIAVLTAWFLWWFLSDLSKELFITLVTAVLTVAGALWVNRNTKLKDRELQIQAQQAEKREKIVGNFMKNFWLIVQDNFKNERVKEQHMQNTISDVMINGSMWLSDETLKKLLNLDSVLSAATIRMLQGYTLHSSCFHSGKTWATRIKV